MRNKIAIGLAILFAALTFVLLPQYGSVSQAASGATTLTLDVSCNGNTFALNRQTPSASSIRRGDTYVLNGTIYPGGTIPAGGTKAEPSTFGPDQSGGIGVWFARGTFLVGAGQFDEEKIQRVSTHYFALNDKSRLFTEGFEGSVEITRAVVGGINGYAGARGLVSMERLGVNSTGSYNLRFTFELQ